MNRRVWAFVCAAGVVGLNLLLEHVLMAAHGDVVLVPGLADFHQAWNHGVSFSLLTQSDATGRMLLMGALAAISVFVAVMAWRATTMLSAIAFGLILGGALGNLADRWAYDGAVFDFLWLHLGRTSLFICNGADIAISAGVVLLLLEGAIAKPEIRPRST